MEHPRHTWPMGPIDWQHAAETPSITLARVMKKGRQSRLDKEPNAHLEMQAIDTTIRRSALHKEPLQLQTLMENKVVKADKPKDDNKIEKNGSEKKPENLAQKSVGDAWIKADALTNCVIVDLRPGVGLLNYLGGFYDLQQDYSLRQAPTYKRRSTTLEHEWWLYYASDDRWHVGRRYQKDRRWPTRRLRSGECKPGTLPDNAVNWQRWLPLAWLSTNIRMQGTNRKQYQDGWKKADAGENCFMIQISDDPIETCCYGSANGLYDLLPKMTPLEPPVFKKRMDYKGCWESLEPYCCDTQLYLYLASDSRWHIGNIKEQGGACIGHRLRSAAVSPGTFPKDANGWEHMKPCSRCLAFLALRCCSFTRWPSLHIRFLCDCPCGCPCIFDCPFGCLGWKPSPAEVNSYKRGAIEDSWKKADNEEKPHRLILRPTMPTSRAWRPSLAPCLWCGTYDLRPHGSNRELVFAKRGCIPLLDGWSCSTKTFLYRSHDGRWRLGGCESKADRRPWGGLLRSPTCKEGVLPGKVGNYWEQKCCCIWLPVSIQIVQQTKKQVVESSCFGCICHMLKIAFWREKDKPPVLAVNGDSR